METDLFDIKLDDQGKQLLLRLNFWTKFFYICTLVTLAFDCINAYLSYRAYYKYSASLMPTLKFQYLVNIIFLVVYAVLLPLQAWFFFRFSTGSINAFQYGNQEEFNSSFQWLLRHAMLAAILFALNSLWAITITVTEIKIYSMI